MARKQHSELTAGIFTISAIVLLVGVVFWLGAGDVFKPAAAKAWFWIDQSRGLQGLQPGAQVKITDVEVGRISDVRLDPASPRTYYVVELFDENTKIYSDARASVSAALVGGGATLQILDCGGRGAARQPADEKHPAPIELGMFDKARTVVEKIDEKFDTAWMQITDLLDTLTREMDKNDGGSAMNKVHAMMDVLEPALASIKKEMDADNEQAVIRKLHETMDSLREIAAAAEPRIQSMLDKMEGMIDVIRPKMGKILEHTEKFVAGAEDFVGKLNTISKKDIAETIKAIHEVGNEVVKIGGSLGEVLDSAGSMIATNRDNIDKIIDNMGQVADNLKTASKEIRRSPWRLLHRPKKEEERSRNIHDAARAFSNGAAQLDQALAKLKGLSEANPRGIPANDPQLKKITDQIKGTFEKFTDAEKALWKELIK